MYCNHALALLRPQSHQSRPPLLETQAARLHAIIIFRFKLNPTGTVTPLAEQFFLAQVTSHCTKSPLPVVGSRLMLGEVHAHHALVISLPRKGRVKSRTEAGVHVKTV